VVQRIHSTRDAVECDCANPRVVPPRPVRLPRGIASAHATNRTFARVELGGIPSTERAEESRNSTNPKCRLDNDTILPEQGPRQYPSWVELSTLPHSKNGGCDKRGVDLEEEDDDERNTQSLVALVVDVADCNADVDDSLADNVADSLANPSTPDSNRTMTTRRNGPILAVVVVVVVVVLGAVSSVPDSLRTAGVAERSAGRGVSW